MKVKIFNEKGQERGMEKSDAMVLEQYCYHRDQLFAIMGTSKTHEHDQTQYHREMMLEALRQLLMWEIIKNTDDLHDTWRMVK